MKLLQSSRSGKFVRVLFRPRFALATGALLLATYRLPSRFDETFEKIANHGQSAPPPEEKKGISAVHAAIAGVVPKYDGRLDAGRWWGDVGEPMDEGSRENRGKTGRASKGGSLMSAFRQQFTDSASTGSGFGGPVSGENSKTGFEATLNMLALNPFGDVQTKAAALPASASFHTSTAAVPFRENVVPVDGGSASVNVPDPRTWNSYGSTPISVSNGNLAVTSLPSAISPVVTTPLTTLASPVINSVTSSTPGFGGPIIAGPVSISAPVVTQPIAVSVPSPTPMPTIIVQPTVPVAKVPVARMMSAKVLLATTAISSPSSGTTAPLTSSLVAASLTGTANIGYQFVPVSNAGNANDPLTGYGGVSYNYNIGKYDVTISQYVTFLNAVAQTDTYGLYNTAMGTDTLVAGISRTGGNGAYQYNVIGDGNRPITYVSWFDAARFANWVNNGQPIGLGEANGSTEDGAYILHGAMSGIVNKSASATVWIPSESEWYKAAYYDPSLNGGAGGYWTGAAKSNAQPGNTIGSDPNQAAYHLNNVYAIGGNDPSVNHLTDVGAFTMSMSPYGTYDQMGDVNQWNDANQFGARGYRGGAWDSDFYNALLSTNASYGDPGSTETNDIGFRLAMIPEPSTWMSLFGGLGVLVAWHRRRKLV